MNSSRPESNSDTAAITTAVITTAAPESRVKRMVPLLGTFVRIELYSSVHSDSFLHEVLEAMFMEIRSVQSLMSYYDPESDVSKINQTPVGEWCEVSPSTARVLQFAETLRVRSHGLFNVGFHEAWSGVFYEFCAASFDRPKIRKLKKAEIDLGGIAKGFAVDQAYAKVRGLHSSGEVFGSINAGGDLYLFEEQEVDLAIQIPVAESIDHRIISLKEGAFATSTARGLSDIRLSYRKKNGERLAGQKTASITAASSMVADALTKVLLLAETPEEESSAADCLRFFRAKGFYEVHESL